MIGCTALAFGVRNGCSSGCSARHAWRGCVSQQCGWCRKRSACCSRCRQPCIQRRARLVAVRLVAGQGGIVNNALEDDDGSTLTMRAAELGEVSMVQALA